MLINGECVIIFWGDGEAIDKLWDALFAALYRKNWGVFSVPEDIIRVRRPKGICDIFSPPPSNPESSVTEWYLAREDLRLQYPVGGKLETHEVDAIRLTLRGQFPGKTELIHFCDKRAKLFGENINFKIMYADSLNGESLEAVYVNGRLVKNEYMYSWDAASYIVNKSRLSVFSEEMWMYLGGWLDHMVDQIIDQITSEKENKEDKD